jgi:hypothetical protein
MPNKDELSEWELMTEEEIREFEDWMDDIHSNFEIDEDLL